jgi:hypothetical protein
MKKDNFDFGCLWILILIAICLSFALFIELKDKSKDANPYSVGSHGSYTIICENGFIYKSIYRRGIIQVRNSDGTFVRCGQSPY